MSVCSKSMTGHNYDLMASCIYCGRSAFQDGNEARAAACPSNPNGRTGHHFLMNDAEHGTCTYCGAAAPTPLTLPPRNLRRPKPVDPLTALTCMWCALPFADITTLEAHEDEC